MHPASITNPATYEFIIPPHLYRYISPFFDFRGPRADLRDLAELVVLFHPSLKDLVFPLFPEDTKEKMANTYAAWVVPFLKAEHTFEPSGFRLKIYNFTFDYEKVAVSWLLSSSWSSDWDQAHWCTTPCVLQAPPKHQWRRTSASSRHKFKWVIDFSFKLHVLDGLLINSARPNHSILIQ